MSETDERTRWVDKVRNLLAKANSTDNEAEREAFQAKALALMARWEISERDVRDSGPLAHNEHRMDMGHFGNAQRGACWVACGVARLFGGFGLVWSGNGKLSVSIEATDEQWARIETLVDHLLPQMMDDILRDRPRSRKSYSLGWSTRVLDRLREVQAKVYADVAAETGRAELVHVPTNEAAEASAVERHGPFRSAPRQTVNGADLAAGKAAGNNADIGVGALT